MKEQIPERDRCTKTKNHFLQQTAHFFESNQKKTKHLKKISIIN